MALPLNYLCTLIYCINSHMLFIPSILASVSIEYTYIVINTCLFQPDQIFGLSGDEDLYEHLTWEHRDLRTNVQKWEGRRGNKHEAKYQTSLDDLRVNFFAEDLTATEGHIANTTEFQQNLRC